MLTTFTATLAEKKLLTHDIYFLRFTLDKPVSFTPGQYVMFKIPQGEDKMTRLFSIASSHTDTNSIEVIAEYIPGGIASEYFKTMSLGDTVTVQAPAGMFCCKDPNQNIIFMVTGTGIAPVRSILKSLLNQSSTFNPPPSLMLLWGVRTIKDVYFLDEFKKLTADYPHFSLKICLSREVDLSHLPEPDRKYFSIGRVNKMYEELLASTNHQPLTTNHYLCGARDTVESLRQYLYEKGVEKEKVIFEKF